MAKGNNVLTMGEVAKICNVAPKTATKWFDSGQLEGYRLPGSMNRRVPVENLIRFLKENNMPMYADLEKARADKITFKKQAAMADKFSANTT